MTERTILITGCSSGIGEHAAHTLKARGWRVFATARKPDVVARLAAEGYDALLLDYTDEATITAAVAEALSRTGGRLDAVFNNGGYGQLGAVEDVSTEALRRQFEANFFGWHALIRAAIPTMRARKSGRIVNTSSVFGLVAMKHRGAYIATKYALEGLSDSLRLELRGTGIHVSLIEPGPIRTRFAATAAANMRETIDLEGSPHSEIYKARLARLERGGASRFKLGPEAVTTRLIEALDSARPKARYLVSTPTHALKAIRRVLPDRVLDRMLAALSDRET